MKSLRVTLSDDHPVVLAGIKALLSGLDGVEVVGEATTGPMAKQMVIKCQPDVAIIDISLPELNGIELTRQIVALVPSVRVLALTVHEDRAYVQPMLQAGARGYLLKRSAADELSRALWAIADGGMYVDPAIAEKAFSSSDGPTEPNGGPISDLANRELEVLKLVARGFSNKEIGLRLNVSIKTIETHKARAVAKLGLRTRADVVRYASIHQWLDEPVGR
jgi:DNA-binding NarL/FixJ family response regulator